MNTKQVWYAAKTDLKSPDTVHQILMFGSLKDIHSLNDAVGRNIVRQLFLRYPKKVYTAPALNFVKNFILDIYTPIDEQKYLKSTSRYTG